MENEKKREKMAPKNIQLSTVTTLLLRDDPVFLNKKDISIEDSLKAFSTIQRKRK